jgi:hypothetical protein
MKQILNRSFLVLIFTLVYVNTVQANQSIESRNLIWFSSSTSSLLNRSSVELATNHVNRGIQFVHKALEKKLNPMDELIANHNLCIGLLASNKTEFATKYCARAFELAEDSFRVVKIRGAFILQEAGANNNRQATLPPMQAIVGNILSLNSQTRFTLMMK